MGLLIKKLSLLSLCLLVVILVGPGQVLGQTPVPTGGPPPPPPYNCIRGGDTSGCSVDQCTAQDHDDCVSQTDPSDPPRSCCGVLYELDGGSNTYVPVEVYCCGQTPTPTPTPSPTATPASLCNNGRIDTAAGEVCDPPGVAVALTTPAPGCEPFPGGNFVCSIDCRSITVE